MGNSPETRSTMEPEIFEVGPGLEKGDIVEITWKDSHAIYGWHELDDLTPSVIVSAGYILKEEEDYVVIVSSNSDSGNHFTALSIPRGCIRQTEVLKKAKPAETPQVKDGRESGNDPDQVEHPFHPPTLQDKDRFADVQTILT